MSVNQHHTPPSAANANRSEGQDGTGFWTSKAALVAVAFLLIAGFFLFSEHRAHALGALPYLLILACPLLHLFMHGGHGRHGRGPTGTDVPRDGAKP